MSHIHRIKVKEDYKLEVSLDNGSVIILNLTSRLKTIRFCPLADPEFFAGVVTDGSFIRWGDLVEISLTELFELARK